MTNAINDITVVIPTIPPRRDMLLRAITSVYAQTLQPNYLVVELDTEGIGAGPTRNRALNSVTSEWVAFLDDDDEFLPHHLEQLLNVAVKEEADIVYPQWTGINVGIFFGRIGRAFDNELAAALRQNNFIPVTTLVRTKKLKAVGGFVSHPDADVNGGVPCEDWGAWLKMLDSGCKFVHHPEVTWRWNGHAGHTSGRIWNA